MNLDVTMFLSQLTIEQKKKLKFWQPDMVRFVLVFPKKVFWFANKNVPIVDIEKQPIVFQTKHEAYSMLQKLKCQD
jgi:hypothetical protein